MDDDVHRVDRNTWIVVHVSSRTHLPRHFEQIEVDDFVFARCWDGRFSDDRCLVHLNDYVLLIDGVILNKAELLKDTSHHSVADLIAGLLGRHGIEVTLAKLRGVFSGAILDKRSQVLYGFGNQTGESAAFSYVKQQHSMLSNNLDVMMRVILCQGGRTTFDEHAAQVMLSYGFMIDDHTFVQEIKRVAPGAVISLHTRSREVETRHYWRLRADRPSTADTIEEAVREFDQLFRRAVSRCFEKDLEYGYTRHLVDLSGGMDARMVNFVGQDLGYASITNITYSDSKSVEARYAIRLATQLGHDCLYHPMDGGRAVLNPRENLRLNSGLAFYSGITGGKFVLESLGFNVHGLEHTGQIGDAVVGTLAKSSTRHRPSPGVGAYSRINVYPSNIDATDEEIFLMDTRVFRGATSSHLIRQRYTFAVSPYTDVDVLDFMFSLPLEWRLNHRLFSLWVQRHYPAALEVPTTRLLGFRLNPIRFANLYLRKSVGVVSRRAQDWLSQREIRTPQIFRSFANSMNPLESWYSTNRELQDLVNSARERTSRLPFSDELQTALGRSFSHLGSIWDKMLAVTVVTMHSLYFTETES